MKRFALSAAVAALALGACSPSGEKAAAPASGASPAAASPAPPSPAADVLTPEGWGPLKIGMTKAEVIAAAGDTATPDAVGGPDEEACTEFHPSRAPEGLYVMIEDGKLSRISIVELSPVKDAKGFGLGAPAADVKAAYGADAQASPHKYQDAPAEYVTVWQGGPRSEPYVQDETARGTVYEIDGTGKVGMIHVGGPSIQLVEGCA